ncbi:N-acetyltransferase domain-containing protein [Pararobbsia alpina]|uniref:GNAT family N-acetyltransferase n=1 Tax=Pararobbsia alpina TaxID=621374 RepID=UPI0039A6B003
MIDLASQYEIVSDEAGFRALETEWNALWDRAQGRYYQAFTVCQLAWQHVGKPLGRRLRCIVGRRDGRVVVIWPLVTYRKWLWNYVLPLSPDAGDYTSVLVEEGPGASTLVAGAWEVARRRCGADFLQMPYLRETQDLYRIASRERRTLLATRHDAWVAKLRSEGEWEPFCQSLGTLFRKKPGTFARRLSKEGDVRVQMTDPSDRTSNTRFVDWLLEHKREWGERVDKMESWITSPHYRDFLVDLLTPHDGEPMARMIVVTLDDEPVAALITSIGNPCAHAIIGAFDARHGKASPGSIAVEQGVRWSFDHRWDLDFGVGSEPFKSYWCRGKASQVWTLHLINSRWGHAAILLKRTLRQFFRNTNEPELQHTDNNPDCAKTSLT